MQQPWQEPWRSAEHRASLWNWGKSTEPTNCKDVVGGRTQAKHLTWEAETHSAGSPGPAHLSLLALLSATAVRRYKSEPRWMEVEGVRTLGSTREKEAQPKERHQRDTPRRERSWCTHPRAWVHTTTTSFHNSTENSLLMEQTPAVP